MKLFLIPVAVLNFVVFTHPWPNYLQNEVNHTVKVSIYYETLCTDSVNFITRQLYPAYKNLRSLLLLEFVPYGKASHQKNYNFWKFKCQHGPLECWGNKVQACALSLRIGQDAEMEFINCFLRGSPNKQSAQICSEIAGIPYPQLSQCVDSEIGDLHLVKQGERTKQVLPALKYVPTIIINDKYDPNLDQRARKNFFKTITEVLHNEVNEAITPNVPIIYVPVYPANVRIADKVMLNNIYDAFVKYPLWLQSY